jgi:hypothetical protein
MTHTGSNHRRVACLVVFVVVLMARANAQSSPRVVHVFVALCDNASQGIQPVPAFLGNGDDPRENLYWGADDGVKARFRRNPDWTLLQTWRTPNAEILLERCLFKHNRSNVYLLAEAYRGRRIRDAVGDFLHAAAGHRRLDLEFMDGGTTRTLLAADKADMLVYIGHDGLMEFAVDPPPPTTDSRPRDAVVLACFSRRYFEPYLRPTGARPLLLTTGLMAPEAYTLEDALDGWIAGESSGRIRERAAAAYARNQDCSLSAARRLFVSAWPPSEP